MNTRLPVIAAAVSALAAGFLLVNPVAANATIPAKYANCTNLHHYYPHGVGRTGARDHVATGGHPVTTWTHSTTAYNTAIHNNARLDADHDSVACEKA